MTAADGAVATRATTTIFSHGRGPPESVLRAFEVTSSVLPLPGGITDSTFVSGNRVLKQAHDDAEAQWAASLLSETAFQSSIYRIPRPVPSDFDPKTFVVESWACSEFVAGKAIPQTMDQWRDLITAARAFHSALRFAVPSKPTFLETRFHRWDHAAHAAFDECPIPNLPDDALHMLNRLGDLHKLIERLPNDDKLNDVDLRPQLVHSDLSGNVLFADGQPPAIIDFSPMWRPVAWAEAIVVSDGLVEYGADGQLIELVGSNKGRLRMLHKAMLFRVISDWLGDEHSMSGMRPKWSAAIELVQAVVANLLT
ncbi:hypothetical protein BKA62DRAFT_470725 [Auriculariales sp. MPI-PUGE-AT-0066]|nr:hypothetical protein BKA62DRAFT_470725 [Auriculariales sp. MPI-PUGE-AT-0066]